MKIIHYVPPLAALVIAAAWLISLRATNTALEQDNISLQKKIADSRNSSVPQNERAKAGAKSAKARRERKPSDNEIKPSDDWVSTSTDWLQLVLFNNDDARYQYSAAYQRLKKLMSEMSGDELVKAYTEMAALPIHAPFRFYLEGDLLDELEKKNPEFAFSQIIANHQMDGDASPRGLRNFDGWFARDPAAATAWYERQLAAGVFDKSLDGKSRAILPMESAYIKFLLASDPAAAEQRMNDIPPDLRGLLGAYMEQVPKANGKAFIDLLRKTMPMEEYMAILRNNNVTEWNFKLDASKNDPKNVQNVLDNLGITSDERSTLLAQHFASVAEYRAMRDTATTPSCSQFDEYREWIQAIDPSAADRATGAALRTYLEKSKTNDARNFVGKLVVDYQSSGAGDELLIPLIEGSATGKVSYPKEKARVLATKIEDDKLREELLQKLN